MTDKQQHIDYLVRLAIDEFNAHESYLISRDLSERCICSKFASYLDRAIARSNFRDYCVDVEYNRGAKGNEYAVKMLHGKNTVVDLIAHKRGYNAENGGFDNLICIEMKKSLQKKKMDSDLIRLETMTDNSFGFCYRAGYMIIAQKSANPDNCKLMIEKTYFNEVDF